jgi:hypothetical protein
LTNKLFVISNSYREHIFIDGNLLLFVKVIFESSDDIIASNMDSNNPWHAIAKQLLKLSSVVYNKFSIEDKTLGDQMAVAVNFNCENAEYWD